MKAAHRVWIAVAACAGVGAQGGALRAETPQQAASQQLIANHQATIAQLQQAIAGEEAAIQQHLDDMEGLRPTWVIGADTHPIIAKFLEIWGRAETPSARREALDTYRWARGEWHTRMWGDDASFGGGTRRDDYDNWNPVLEDGMEHADAIGASLDRIDDLQSAIDSLNQVIAGLTGSIGQSPLGSSKAPARDAHSVPRVAPRPMQIPRGQKGPPRGGKGRY